VVVTELFVILWFDTEFPKLGESDLREYSVNVISYCFNLVYFNVK